MARRAPPLTPAMIVSAYSQGLFPMADEVGVIRWYAPDPRAIFPLDSFHAPRSLLRTIRRGTFEVTVNRDFPAVIRACSERDVTWISEELLAAYVALHRDGLAHSVEAFQDGVLVGGLYGVALGGAFMGESMFSREPDASKVCLVALVKRLEERGFTLLDSQLPTEHLARFGQALVPRAEYLRQLALALSLQRTFA